MHQVYCSVKTPYHNDIQHGDPEEYWEKSALVCVCVCVWGGGGGVTEGKVTQFDDRTFNEVTGK